MPKNINQCLMVNLAFAEKNRKWLYLITLILFISIVWVDVITEPFLRLAFLYCIPLTISAFLLSRWYTILLSVIASGINTYTMVSLLPTAHYILFDFVFMTLLFFGNACTITLLRTLIEELYAQASTDHLTHIKTSRFFYAFCDMQLSNAQRYQYPISLAFIDLDNFKQVNDIYGHAKGDDVLTQMCSIISSNLRAGDMVGRLGGDEFAVLFDHANAQDVQYILERIMMEINALPKYGVTVSVGVIVNDSFTSVTTAQLIAMADHAMYTIKNSTKNGVAYVHI